MKVVYNKLKCIVYIGMVLFLSSTYAWASDVILLKSANIKPYNDAVSGFRSTYEGGFDEILLSDVASTGVLKTIYDRHPGLIVAVGLDALASVKEVTEIPIIYAMVSNPQPLIHGRKNITGVSMDITFDKQLAAFLGIVQEIKRIGLIYDPRNTGHLSKEAQLTASRFGIECVLREVSAPNEVPQTIKGMKGKVDAFWMLPDTTVLTRDNEEYLFLTFIENNIPILTFSERYVQMGALMALGIDAYDIGKQVGEITNRLEEGNGIGIVTKISPRKRDLILNPNMAQRFFVPMDEEIVRKARITR